MGIFSPWASNTMVNFFPSYHGESGKESEVKFTHHGSISTLHLHDVPCDIVSCHAFLGLGRGSRGVGVNFPPESRRKGRQKPLFVPVYRQKVLLFPPLPRACSWSAPAAVIPVMHTPSFIYAYHGTDTPCGILVHMVSRTPWCRPTFGRWAKNHRAINTMANGVPFNTLVSSMVFWWLSKWPKDVLCLCWGGLPNGYQTAHTLTHPHIQRGTNITHTHIHTPFLSWSLPIICFSLLKPCHCSFTYCSITAALNVSTLRFLPALLTLASVLDSWGLDFDPSSIWTSPALNRAQPVATASVAWSTLRSATSGTADLIISRKRGIRAEPPMRCTAWSLSTCDKEVESKRLTIDCFASVLIQLVNVTIPLPSFLSEVTHLLFFEIDQYTDFRNPLLTQLSQFQFGRQEETFSMMLSEFVTISVWPPPNSSALLLNHVCGQGAGHCVTSASPVIKVEIKCYSKARKPWCTCSSTVTKRC